MFLCTYCLVICRCSIVLVVVSRMWLPTLRTLLGLVAMRVVIGWFRLIN